VFEWAEYNSGRGEWDGGSEKKVWTRRRGGKGKDVIARLGREKGIPELLSGKLDGTIAHGGGEGSKKGKMGPSRGIDCLKETEPIMVGEGT